MITLVFGVLVLTCCALVFVVITPMLIFALMKGTYDNGRRAWFAFIFLIATLFVAYYVANSMGI